MFSGDAEFRSQLDAKAYDFQTVEIKSLVKAGEEQQLFYETVSHLGRNRKQETG